MQDSLDSLVYSNPYYPTACQQQAMGNLDADFFASGWATYASYVADFHRSCVSVGAFQYFFVLLSICLYLTNLTTLMLVRGFYRGVQNQCNNTIVVESVSAAAAASAQAPMGYFSFRKCGNRLAGIKHRRDRKTHLGSRYLLIACWVGALRVPYQALANTVIFSHSSDYKLQWELKHVSWKGAFLCE